MSSNNVIQLDGVLNEVQSDLIQTYSTSTIIQLSEQFDKAIDSSAIVGSPTLNYIIFTESVDSTVVFGAEDFALNMQLHGVQSVESTVAFGQSQINQSLIADSAINENEFDAPQLNFIIYPDAIASDALFGWDEPLVDMQIAGVNSIVSTVEFGDSKLNTTIYPNDVASSIEFGVAKVNQKLVLVSVDSTVAFETPKISYTIFANSIPSSVEFGWDEPLLNMQIVVIDEIESEAVVATPNVKKVIGPLSINTTANFGIPAFTDNIHRLLIFKQDNLTKVGDTDAVVVAGGIRINPSLTKSTEAFAGNATLPSNPVGFISVNIDGNDYKIPYYNN